MISTCQSNKDKLLGLMSRLLLMRSVPTVQRHLPLGHPALTLIISLLLPITMSIPVPGPTLFFSNYANSKPSGTPIISLASFINPCLID